MSLTSSSALTATKSTCTFAFLFVLVSLRFSFVFRKNHFFYTRGQPISWLEVQKRASSINEVAIGYYSGKSVLNPPQDEVREYLPGDKVVVISEDDTEYVQI